MIARNTCSPSREIAAHHQRNAQAAARCASADAQHGRHEDAVEQPLYARGGYAPSDNREMALHSMRAAVRRVRARRGARGWHCRAKDAGIDFAGTVVRTKIL